MTAATSRRLEKAGAKVAKGTAEITGTRCCPHLECG